MSYHFLKCFCYLRLQMYVYTTHINNKLEKTRNSKANMQSIKMSYMCKCI